VCSRWAEGWKATSEGRRRLRKVAFDFPHLLGENMAVVPGDDKQLVVRSGDTVRILSRDMSIVSSFEMPTSYGGVAASEEFIYATHHFKDITSRTHDGTKVAKYQDPDNSIDCPVLGPGGCSSAWSTM